MNTQTASLATEADKKKTPLWHKITVVLGIMFVIGGSLTGIMTYMNLGYTDGFFYSWMSSFLTALVTVMPAGFILMALVTKLVEKLFPTMGEQKRNLIVGIGMASVMESFMAFSTAMNNIGLSNFDVFYSAWLHALIAALPVSLLISTIMSMTVKPKMERFLRS
ncbi:DUF2798 domain-containing protein [Marinomonas pollencensis]|uniref:DUF2798 domain-containing protein n=1 Tax=Marinomonas pollencensis TaxID=491954 RepID=UPI001C6ED644|nr:DUF2798 domain-containing protein [Marinomonas pollencensis]